jgi:DNA-binding NtrC family response regulator
MHRAVAPASESHAAPKTEAPLCRRTSRGDIVGRAPAVLDALRVLDRVAPSPCTVLITGHSGTGKESLVGALHDASPRRHAPLVAVNCGAIPSELADAELFGHARGAFTGASSARGGFVAAAEGGTLFFDEVGELPPNIQVKLLRLLQQREYVPVGESRAQRCDIRVVAATNRDLENEVISGRFREDLYHRLNVVHVRAPALRERMGDLPLLVEHFLKRFCTVCERTDILGLNAEAQRAVQEHPWHGNIRELENTIERAVWTAEGPYIAASDLFPRGKADAAAGPAPVSGVSIVQPSSGAASSGATSSGAASSSQASAGQVSSAPVLASAAFRRRSSTFPALLPDAGIDMVRAAERYQNHLIEQALLRTANNKNRAAQLLGLNRTTLSEMIRRRGLKGT